MRDQRFSNERIQKKYQKLLTESKKGYRRKVQLIDDRIDDLIDDIEKKIAKEDENPVYQRKLYQMLADMNKEHGEFLMSIKRIASTIDSGSKTVPLTKGEMQPNNQQGYEDDPAAAPGAAAPAGQSMPGQPQETSMNEAKGYSLSEIQTAMKKAGVPKDRIKPTLNWLKNPK